MKKILSLATGAMCFLAVSAQSENAAASAHYTLTHVMDTTQRDNPLVQKFVLYLGSSLSRYTTDVQAMRAGLSNFAVSGGVTGGTLQASTVSMDEMKTWQLAGSYIKQPAQNKMFYMAMAGMKLFAVEEPVPPIDWQISNETKEVMGMPCQKANGHFKGRDYEAWFTTQIPYSNGPWKLGGLPGLIVEAYDKKKEVVFTLNEFKSLKDTTIEITIPSTAAKTTPKEYKQYRDAITQNAQAASGAVGTITGGTFRSTVSGSLAGGTQAVRPRQMNNPIEKEN